MPRVWTFSTEQEGDRVILGTQGTYCWVVKGSGKKGVCSGLRSDLHPLWLKQGRGVHWGPEREARELTSQAELLTAHATLVMSTESCLCGRPPLRSVSVTVPDSVALCPLQTRKQVQIGCVTWPNQRASSSLSPSPEGALRL